MKLKEYINGKFQASVIVVVIGIGNVSLNCVFLLFFWASLNLCATRVNVPMARDTQHAPIR